MQAFASLGKSFEKKYGKSLIGQYIKSRGGLFTEGSFDVLLFIFLSILIFVGLTMLYSASYPNAYTDGYDPAYYFKNQVTGVAIGVVLMAIVGKINHMLFMEAGAVLGSLVSIGLLVLAIFIGGSDDGGNIKRWITIAGIRFQPSDIAKFTLILTLAFMLHRWHHLMVSKKPLKTNNKWINGITAEVNRKIGRPVFNESWKSLWEASL